jgi:uncharacterized protein YecT (DUF1311 family)
MGISYDVAVDRCNHFLFGWFPSDCKPSDTQCQAEEIARYQAEQLELDQRHPERIKERAEEEKLSLKAEKQRERNTEKAVENTLYKISQGVSISSYERTQLEESEEMDRKNPQRVIERAQNKEASRLEKLRAIQEWTATRDRHNAEDELRRQQMSAASEPMQTARQVVQIASVMQAAVPAPSLTPKTKPEPITASPVNVPTPPATQTSTMAGNAAKSPSKVVEASFDCSKASSPIEKLICSTPETASADKRLSEAYSAARKQSADEAKLKADQIKWMKGVRNKCADAACLVKVTEDRIQFFAVMGE